MREFNHLGAKTFAIVRHPCETLLSLASKIERPAHGVIDDFEWISQMAKSLAFWHESLASNLRHVTVLKYEDLIARDPKALRSMAEAFGVSCDDQEIAEIYDAVLFRNLLPQVGGHFYQGGNDKWRGVFRPETMQIIREQGLEPVFRRFEYDGMDRRTRLTDRPSAVAPNRKCHGMLGRDLYLDGTHTRIHHDSPTLVASNDDRVFQSVRELLGSQLFCRLIQSGGGDWLHGTGQIIQRESPVQETEAKTSCAAGFQNTAA
jgi:hypothetical protein